MKKNFAKNRMAKRAPLPWWQRALLLSGLLILLVASSAVVYQYQNKSVNAGFMTQLTRFKTWALEHRGHLQHGISGSLGKVKQLAHKNDAEPEIHFEFYTALANMQVKVVEPVKEVEEKVKAPIVANKALSRKAMKFKVASADELEKELSEEIKK